MRVALIFDNIVRPNTAGIHCLRALEQMSDVKHFLPAQITEISRDHFDLFLYIDDGLNYLPDQRLKPSALWAIDTHLNAAGIVRFARNVDFVFAAQRDGLAMLLSNGINCLGWLPLACDPRVHRKFEIAKELDVCFIGQLVTEPRRQLAKLVHEQFASSLIGQRFLEDMARTYSATRVVLNLSVRNDINMRIFEALACGSLLVTNDLEHNGLEKLFHDGEHLVVYRDFDELLDKVHYFLGNAQERERIAAAGRAEVVGRHSYLHRMQILLTQVSLELERPSLKLLDHNLVAPSQTPVVVPALSDVAPPRKQPDDSAQLTSIVIVTLNAWEFTKQCLDSVSRHTDLPYELIIVDNGSSDGTLEYLKSRTDIRLICNSQNRGFPAAANQGIKASRGVCILLLNNDVLVTPDWLAQLKSALNSSAEIGLVGPVHQFSKRRTGNRRELFRATSG